jgi:raffinose/stachyose/melibiose transport system substrate-binding protein
MKTFRYSAALAGRLWTSGMAQAEVTLSVLLDGNADTIAIDGGADGGLYGREPDVTFEMENRPGGSEGDNMVKTRLATGEAGDIIQYNSGSLFQALKPPKRWPT